MRHRTQFPAFELTLRYALIALGSVVGTVLASAAALVAGSLVSDVAAGTRPPSIKAPFLLTRQHCTSRRVLLVSWHFSVGGP